ncbi:hypothetical protein AB0C29_10660 [Actinoplanes sp. NPDC048791]|uniref:hypothetical protein n=1 Tax=Actinoplanes sp. NPDC048791 TaxID=3154623 RepID=UPI0033DD247E
MSQSSPNIVEANIDVYGTYARASALADYLEVAAVQGIRITKDGLADIAEQLNWSRKSRRAIIVESDDPADDPDAWPEEAFTALSERQDILRDKYPFALRSTYLKYDKSIDPRDSPYIGLLALTVIHAWKLTCSVRPTDRLEAIAADVLRGKQLQVAGMGTADRGGVGFVENLSLAAKSVGLNAALNPVPRKRSAKDAGVDTLAAFTWKDGRRGHWVMIGQVTCAKSNEWKMKLNQAEPGTWRSYLQEPLDPQPFLVIPHHIEARMLEDLLSSGRGLVLDRLRLTEGKSANSIEDITMIEALLAAQVQ